MRAIGGCIGDKGFGILVQGLKNGLCFIEDFDFMDEILICSVAEGGDIRI